MLTSSPEGRPTTKYRPYYHVLTAFSWKVSRDPSRDKTQPSNDGALHLRWSGGISCGLIDTIQTKSIRQFSGQGKGGRSLIPKHASHAVKAGGPATLPCLARAKRGLRLLPSVSTRLEWAPPPPSTTIPSLDSSCSHQTTIKVSSNRWVSRVPLARDGRVTCPGVPGPYHLGELLE